MPARGQPRLARHVMAMQATDTLPRLALRRLHALRHGGNDGRIGAPGRCIAPAWL